MVVGGNVTAVYEYAIQGFAVHGVSRAALERLPFVGEISADIVIKQTAQSLPTGINRIDADKSSAALINGVDERVDVDVAVIDGGVDLDHPDLNVVAGFDCTKGPSCTKGGDGNDDNGHGTHVAGTIAALDNDFGVVGVAPGARIWAMKALNNGSGWLSDIIEAIDLVTANADQIEVVNMSLSGQGYVPQYQQAIANSVAAGVVYVVAAGNESRDVYGPDGVFGTGDDTVPAAYPEVATISALADSDGQAGGVGNDFYYSDGSFYTADDSFAPFSNYGRSVVGNNPVSSPGASIDMMMPGVLINSTHLNGGYDDTYSGTSMASPHAAGLAALEIAQNGRAYDAAGVYAIRQTLIDQAYGQTSANGLVDQTDPDNNPEPIGYALVGDVPIAPTVNITTPNTGDVATGTISISASASDEDGTVTSVAFSANGINIGTDTDGTDGWNVTWDTTIVADGLYSIVAIATDDSGLEGSDSIDVTVDNENDSPVAGFTFTTSDLIVNFTDTSTDSDSSVVSWIWDFGDGNTSTEQNPSNTYSAAGTYIVSLTVTDDEGAADTYLDEVIVVEAPAISLSAVGYKVRGVQKVDLSWSGAVSTNVDVVRNGAVIANTANDGSYTDNIDQRGGGSYIYRLCETGSDTSCSGEVTISF